MAQSNADQQEHQRLLGLQQDNLRNIEQNRASQAANDRAQASSHSRLEGGGNSTGTYMRSKSGPYISTGTYQQRPAAPPHK